MPLPLTRSPGKVILQGHCSRHQHDRLSKIQESWLEPVDKSLAIVLCCSQKAIGACAPCEVSGVTLSISDCLCEYCRKMQEMTLSSCNVIEIVESLSLSRMVCAYATYVSPAPEMRRQVRSRITIWHKSNHTPDMSSGYDLEFP